MNDRNLIVLDSYKSQWIQRKDTGCYERRQKTRYPLDWIDNQLFCSIPKVRGIMALLGKKKQGVDYYRYYSEVLSKGDRGKWKSEFKNVKEQLEQIGLSVTGKSALDISGEPGYFASEATSFFSDVVATAFADNVSLAIRDHLNISTETYDFNTDNLLEIFKDRRFDFIFVRYAIGFCKDLNGFVQQCRQILSQNGIVYISFSPASRAVCARWMFDDYTYLVQYTKKFLTNEFTSQGFIMVGEFNEGSYLWDKDLHFTQKFFSGFYTKEIFDQAEKSEFYQHNLALVFNRKD